MRAQRTWWALELTMALAATVFGVVLLPFAPFMAGLRHGQHRWWMTDRRIAVRNGFIGYTTRSIPLDRIADVTIGQTLFERMFGLTHIMVRDMGEGCVVLWGVEDAHRTKEAILAAAKPVRTDTDRMGEVIGLLQQIAAAA